MKRLLLLPALVVGFALLSCDRQVPTEPESASIAADPLFGKTPPNTILDYTLQRLQVRYDSKNEVLKVKIAFKNVSVIECSSGKPNIRTWYQPPGQPMVFLELVSHVCDPPGGGGGTVAFEKTGALSPGTWFIRALIDDPVTSDVDDILKEFTVR